MCIRVWVLASSFMITVSSFLKRKAHAKLVSRRNLKATATDRLTRGRSRSKLRRQQRNQSRKQWAVPVCCFSACTMKGTAREKPIRGRNRRHYFNRIVSVRQTDRCFRVRTSHTTPLRNVRVPLACPAPPPSGERKPAHAQWLATARLEPKHDRGAEVCSIQVDTDTSVSRSGGLERAVAC